MIPRINVGDNENNRWKRNTEKIANTAENKGDKNYNESGES